MQMNLFTWQFTNDVASIAKSHQSEPYVIMVDSAQHPQQTFLVMKKNTLLIAVFYVITLWGATLYCFLEVSHL